MDRVIKINNVCTRVSRRERQLDERLGKDGHILTQEVTAVHCSHPQAMHSPHACNIIHAYHTCVCVY